MLTPRTLIRSRPVCVAALVLALASTYAADVRSQDARTLTLYSGSVGLEQGGESVGEFDAKVTLVTHPNQAGRVLAIRHLVPTTQVAEQAPLAMIDVLDLSSGIPEPIDYAPYELEEAAHTIDLFVPLEVLPEFKLPASGTEQKESKVIDVLGFAKPTVELKVTAAEKDGQLIVERSLGGTALPSFRFRDLPAELAIFRQTYRLQPQSREVLSYEGHLKVDVLVDEDSGQKVSLERKIRLASPPARSASAEELAILDDLDAALSALDARKASTEIEPLIQALTKKAASSSLDSIGTALTIRLAAFTQTYESSPEGKMLAKLLGHQVPDFKLKDVDGKEIDFREFTKGKVTILSFWGYT